MTGRRAIGIDLGGTTLNAGLVDDAGGVTHWIQQPCRVGESAEAPLQVIEGMVARLRGLAGGDVAAVGLGVPGVIDPARGALVDRTAHLPHWHALPIRDVLAPRLGLPLAVDNDANAAAW